MASCGCAMTVVIVPMRTYRITTSDNRQTSVAWEPREAVGWAGVRGRPPPHTQGENDGGHGDRVDGRTELADGSRRPLREGARMMAEKVSFVLWLTTAVAWFAAWRIAR